MGGTFSFSDTGEKRVGSVCMLHRLKIFQQLGIEIAILNKTARQAEFLVKIAAHELEYV